MKKRLVATVMAAMAASLIAALGSSAYAADEYDVENREYDGVTIDVLTRMDSADGQGIWYNEMVQRFMEKYPGITVNQIDIPTEADYLDQESISMSDPSSLPNIFMQYGGSRVKAYIDSDLIVEMTPYFEQYPEWYDSFSSTSWGVTDFSSYGYEGTYGLPWGLYQVMLFYNEDILAENDIDPASILSWDDLMDACQKLLDNGVQPFEMGEKDNYRFGHLHTCLNYKTYGTAIAEQLGNDEVSYDSEEETAIYQMIIDAYEKGYLGTNLLGNDDGTERELFNTGKTAFLFMGTWYCAECSNGGNELYDAGKIHALRMPYVNEEYAKVDMGGNNDSYYIVNTGNEDEIAASVLFMKYMTSEEEVAQMLQHYTQISAVKCDVDVDNYLIKEAMEIVNSTEDSHGDIENYDTAAHMINTVRNALQMIPSGATAEDVGKEIVNTSKEYE